MQEKSEILQMLLSEDDDDVHLALILITEGRVRVSREEIDTFINRGDMSPYRELYPKVKEWTETTHGKVYIYLRALAEKSQELSNQ